MTHRLAGIALAGLLAIPALASPQTVGPDELRLNITPYVPAPALTLRTGVELVEVPVVVRDSHAKGIRGLQQGDFTLYDGGKKQQITAFSIETFASSGAADASAAPLSGSPASTPAGAQPSDAPRRYIALCLDDLNTDIESLVRAKKAAREFVQTSLAPGDRVAVVTTSRPHDSQFTGDPAAMLALIDKVQNNTRYSDNVALECPPIKAYEAYLIVNRLDDTVLDAKLTEARKCMSLPADRSGQIGMITAAAAPIWQRVLINDLNTLRAVESMVDGLAKIPGRRMLLLASSGFFSGNLEGEEELLLAKALRSGVVINTLAARGVSTAIPFGDGTESRSITSRTAGKGRSTPSAGDMSSAQSSDERTESRAAMAKNDVLDVLASGTGGTFFHDNNDLLKGFRQLGMAPDVMYVLGFSPSDAVANGSFHNLKVQLAAGKRYTVEARKGYYAPSKPRPAAEQPSQESRLDAEMQATDILSNLPASLTWSSDRQAHLVTCTVRIDLNALKLATHDDRRTQTLTLVAALRDAAGNVVSGKRYDAELNLKSDTLARLIANGGLRITLNLEAPPEARTARGLVREGIEGKMVTSSQELQLP